MSIYYTIRGRVFYPSLEDLYEVADYLRESGWMNDEYKWTDEKGRVRGQGQPLNESVYRLDIPWGSYRNLNRAFDQILEPARDGRLVVTTTDGRLMGWICEPNKPVEAYNLRDWWSEDEMTGDIPEPGDDGYIKWIDWVEAMFHEEHSIITGSSPP